MTRTYDFVEPAITTPVLSSEHDDPDHRDLQYTSTADGSKLPTNWDLRRDGAWPLAQGCDNSVVTSAACAVANYAASMSRSLFKEPLSRLFLSYNAEAIQPGGSNSTRLLLKALQRHGLCREADWPDTLANKGFEPPKATYGAVNIAVNFKYLRVQQTRIDLMKALVAEGPVLATLTVYPAFVSKKVRDWGELPLPGTGESCKGQVTAVIVGYDDLKERFLLQTSFGPFDWGLGGCCWVPYKYLLDPLLCSDLWVMTPR